MDEFRRIQIAQTCFDFGTGAPGNAAGFAAGVVAQTTGNFMAGFVQAGNNGAAFEFSFNRGDANGQQAAARAERLAGSRIQLDAAGQLQVIGQPLFACS